MASIEQLKQQIDLEDLAQRLGLKRPKAKGNWCSPHHDDKNPSLSIFQQNGVWYFKDWSDPDEPTGTCIDFVMYVEGCDIREAVRRLHEIYSIPMDRPDSPGPPREKTRAEYIAERCKQSPEKALPYLTDERGIPAEIVNKAIQFGAIGWNEWVNPKANPGEIGYGGNAVAFIARSVNPGHVVGVDMRYVDPDLNGGLKTQSQGEKEGFPWFMDLQRLQFARTVYVVESSINALSIESCQMPYTAAIAVRGTKALDAIDWSFYAGKQLVLAFDNDEPDRKGRCAGQEASWRLYDILTAKNISALMVDQADWEAYNDVNDILQDLGPDELKYKLQHLQPWAIQGLPGNSSDSRGRSRIFLPGHDYSQYWKYRVKPDFTTYISKYEKDEETGQEQHKYQDLAGFRVAAISRIRVASPSSVLSGEQDLAPKQMFAVSVQTPRHGHTLQRRVFEDDELHNADQWRKFGPVFSPSAFSRLVSILERSADLGARDAINFVGLGWLDGRLMVNEGPDCYFSDPEQQCPYNRLRFPSGHVGQARQILKAYSRTFTDNQALLTLIWSLGGHLKALLGFWPHMVMQAEKGAGKSTLTKKMENTIGMTMFGHESIGTSFRVITSVSHTSHPIGWEEISAGRQEIIDQAVTTLQQTYQYAVTRRGAKMLEFLLSAPVLLAGEDVPVKSLEGKVLRVDLNNRKGDPLPANLPQFPLKEWLQYLAGLRRDRVQEMYREAYAACQQRCSARENDSIADRMVSNYGALRLAWWLLCDFAGLEPAAFNLEEDLVTAQNRHIVDTEADREPWVWIIEVVLSELDSNRYKHPYSWGTYSGKDALFVRHTDIMNHIRTNTHLRDIWNSLPVKTPRVLKQQLHRAGVVLTDKADKHINGRRLNHMLALSCDQLEKFGLSPAPRIEDEPDLPGMER